MNMWKYRQVSLLISGLLLVALLMACGGQETGFRITEVEHPTTVVAGGERGDLTIHWEANRSFQ